MLNTLRHYKQKLLRTIGLPKRASAEIHVYCERLGSEYGGWWLCPDGIDDRSVIYSFGIGEDITFDLALIQKFGATVHAFDPTPKSQSWMKGQRLPENFHSHSFGIAAFDGEASFFTPKDPDYVSGSLVSRPDLQNEAIKVPMKRLNTIMRELGHNRIDLLKLDIEGAEYEIIDDVIAGDFPIRQLLVEFHHRFPEFGFKKTSQALRKLRRHGYRLFKVSETGEEFSFLRPLT